MSTLAEQFLTDLSEQKVSSVNLLARKMLDALLDIIDASNSETVQDFAEELHHFSQTVQSADERLVLLRNVLRYCIDNVHIEEVSPQDARARVRSKIEEAKKHLNVTVDTIPRLLTQKVKPGFVILVYGFNQHIYESLVSISHSQTKVDILVAECAPLFEGKKLVEKLERANVHCKYITDSMLRFAVKQADLVLLHVDGFDHNMKGFAPIGSEIVAELSLQHKTNVYACIDGWQYDPTLTFREDEDVRYVSDKQIWSEAPSGVDILTYAYEKVEAEKISYVVCELGILEPKHFQKQVTETYDTLY